jgi:hypothetical protein
MGGGIDCGGGMRESGACRRWFENGLWRVQGVSGRNDNIRIVRSTTILMTLSRLLKPLSTLPLTLQNLGEDHIKLTDKLGNPRNHTKDHESQVAELLGIEHNTTTFELDSHRQC